MAFIEWHWQFCIYRCMTLVLVLERGNNIVFGNIVLVNIVFILTSWWLFDGDIVNSNIVFNIVKDA